MQVRFVLYCLASFLTAFAIGQELTRFEIETSSEKQQNSSVQSNPAVRSRPRQVDYLKCFPQADQINDLDKVEALDLLKQEFRYYSRLSKKSVRRPQSVSLRIESLKREIEKREILIELERELKTDEGPVPRTLIYREVCVEK